MYPTRLYGGTEDNISESKIIHEICKTSSKVQMEHNSNQNRWINDTPDDLYSKFIGIVAGLPDDATKWSLPLCTTYFSAPVVNLQDKMEEYKFNMPSQSGLLTKLL